MKKKVFAHTLVRNEEKWVWYSVMSVIDYVDKILLWNMSSTDKTLAIIKEIKKKYPQKISLRTVPKVDPNGFRKVRQEMLDETDSDWFLVVDGDEIWWEESIKKVRREIENSKLQDKESIVVPMVNLVGDIFHYQEETAGMYKLAGKKGHLALRAINRRIPGLISSNPHGTWGWADKNGNMIQNRNPEKIQFVDAPYMHATFLPRSGSRELDKSVIKRGKKYKYEIGISFPRDYYFPEVLFLERPEVVSSPWFNMDKNYYLRALIETPLRKIKRRVLKSRVGY